MTRLISLFWIICCIISCPSFADQEVVEDLGVPEWSGPARTQLITESNLASLPDIMSTHEVELSVSKGRPVVLNKGTKAFLDSDEEIGNFPNQLIGRTFFQSDKSGYTVTVSKGGYMAALVPENSAAEEYLDTLGFVRVNLRPFYPFRDEGKLNAVFLQKVVNAGDVLEVKPWTLIIFGIADTGGIPYSERKSLEPAVFLPDGREFKTWEIPFSFSKTYYVATQNPGASDRNPGTKIKPFKTISKAAAVLKPGERVIVGPGIYREHVKPALGGLSRDKIISYEAEPGAVITGAERLKAKWTKSSQDPSVFPYAGSWNHPWDKDNTVHYNLENLWMCTIPEELIAENNPFTKVNLSQWMLQHLAKISLMSKEHTAETEIYFKYRGLVFQDGKMLTQVIEWENFKRKGQPGSFWVAEDGRTLHVRPFEDANPADCEWEITTREQLFCPEAYNLGYIRVKGFTMEKAANPFPIPQYGALSTNAGHHWIIENNTIRWINSIGIDLGKRSWMWNGPEFLGYHIVRGNIVTDCGICGISGIGGRDFALLVEDNIVDRNAWHNVCVMMETSGIKTHFNENCLYRRNIIQDTYYGPGIWLDFGNINCRVTQHVVTGSNSPWGGLFFEASLYHNMIDNNFCWGNQGHGIYQHTCQKLIIANNFSGNNTGSGLQLNMGKRYVYGRTSTGGYHQVLNNIFFNNGTDIAYPPDTPPMEIENNIREGIHAEFDPETLLLRWHGENISPKSIYVPYMNFNFWSKPVNSDSSVGPFGEIPSDPETIRINPMESDG